MVRYFLERLGIADTRIPVQCGTAQICTAMEEVCIMGRDVLQRIVE